MTAITIAIYTGVAYVCWGCGLYYSAPYSPETTVFFKWRVVTYRQSRRCLCFHIQRRRRPSPPFPGIWPQRSRTGFSGGPSSSTLPRWTTAERTGCTRCTSPCRTEHRQRGMKPYSGTQVAAFTHSLIKFYFINYYYSGHMFDGMHGWLTIIN